MQIILVHIITKFYNSNPSFVVEKYREVPEINICPVPDIMSGRSAFVPVILCRSLPTTKVPVKCNHESGSELLFLNASSETARVNFLVEICLCSTILMASIKICSPL